MSITDKEVNKFYGRVRSHLEDGERQKEVRRHEGEQIIINKSRKGFECYDNIKDDKMFGKITEHDFSKILASYDQQQANPNLSNKPVMCKSVVGGNFQKLLYLRSGFHNSGSTDYLINNLEIDDVNRISLLGGHSDYNLCKGEDVLSITRLNNRIYIREYLDKAWGFLKANKENHLANQFIQKAHQLDPNFGDTIGCWAKYYDNRMELKRAISMYEQALNSETLENRSRVINSYVDCLYNEGIRLISRKVLTEAKEIFQKILTLKPDHDGSKLHLSMCDNAISQYPLQEKKKPTYTK